MSKYPDISIDIETLCTRPTAVILSVGQARKTLTSERLPCTRPTAVILSVGAVAFDRSGGDEYLEAYWRLDPAGQPGRSVSADTVLWWLRQDPAARDEAFGGRPAAHNALLDARRQAGEIKEFFRARHNGR